MNKMLQFVAPDGVENKSVLPIGFVKIDLELLEGFNEDTECIITDSPQVVVASEGIKLSNAANDEGVDVLNNNTKQIFLHAKAPGKYSIGIDKYSLTQLDVNSSARNVVLDIINIFDTYSNIEVIGQKGMGAEYFAAKLNFSNILEYPTSLAKIQLTGTRVTGDISSVAKLTGLTYLSLSGTGVTGYISSVANLTGLTNLDLSSTGVTGDISSVANLTGLTNLALSSTGVTGDISSVANLTGLTNLALSGTGVTGSIENFVHIKRTNGVTSGSLQGSSANWGKCTFNGGIAKGNRLTWTSTTITMNGVTINA